MELLLNLARFCLNSAGLLPEFAEVCRNSKSRRIRTYPEVSGIGTSSAEICMQPLGPLLAPAAPLSRSAGRSPGHVAASCSAMYWHCLARCSSSVAFSSGRPASVLRSVHRICCKGVPLKARGRRHAVKAHGAHAVIPRRAVCSVPTH